VCGEIGSATGFCLQMRSWGTHTILWVSIEVTLERARSLFGMTTSVRLTPLRREAITSPVQFALPISGHG